MTPEEHAAVAGRILDEDLKYCCIRNDTFVPVVAAEIRAAVEEAETKERMMHTLMVAAFDQRDKAKAEAYEDAAKIAESLDREEGPGIVRWIAREIRAKAKSAGSFGT